MRRAWRWLRGLVTRAGKADPSCAMCGGTGLTLGMPPCPCLRPEKTPGAGSATPTLKGS